MDPRARGDAIGIAMYLLAALLFGLNGVLAKSVIAVGIDPAHFAQLRNTGSAAILLAYLAIRSPARLRITWRDVPFLAAYGAVAFTLVQFFYFVAISRLPVGFATLIGFTAPLLVALWIRFVRKARTGPLIWVALVLILGGLAVVAEVWTGLRFDLLGIGAGVGAAVMLTVYWLLGEHGATSRDALSLTTWGFLFATLIWAIVLPLWDFPWLAEMSLDAQPLGPGGPSVLVWQLALWCVVMGGLLPFVLALASVHRIGSQRAGIAATSEPIWAALFAMVMIGEVPSWWQAFGGLVVIGGIILAEASSRRSIRPLARTG